MTKKMYAATLNEEILLCLLNIFYIFKRIPVGFLENCANQFFSTSDLHFFLQGAMVMRIEKKLQI